MKTTKPIIKLIDLYKSYSTISVNRCKHIPSCSTYSKESIENHGLVVGGYFSMIRIIKCNPLVKPKVDMPLTTMDVDRC